MTATRTKIDTDNLKSAAAGRWQEIISAICPIDADILDGRHHPCPKCGGTDRCRAFNDFAETGGVFCNQCHNENCGDGFSTIQWIMDCDFPTAIKLVANFLGIQPGSNGRAKRNSKAKTNGRDRQSKPFNLDEKVKWLPTGGTLKLTRDRVFESFAKGKPPITVEAILAAGGRVCRWPKKAPEPIFCVAFPTQPVNGGRPKGCILYRPGNEDFPAVPTMGLDLRKTHIPGGSKDGLVVSGGWSAVKEASVIVKVEGLPDLLAITPHLPPDHAVVTNICGANSKDMGKLPLSPFKNKQMIIVGDADVPGQDGASKFARQAAAKIDDVRIAKLPYDIAPTRGKDLRDFVREGGDVAKLLAAAVPVEPVSEPTAPVIDNGRDELPDVFLPGEEATVSLVARTLGRLLGETEQYYRRGGAMVRLVKDGDKPPTLKTVPTPALPAAFETVAKLKKIKETKFGPIEVSAICSESHARLISHADPFLEKIPPIDLVSPSPVLVERDGQIIQVVGYDRQSRVLAHGNEAPEVPLTEAITIIQQVVGDFRFAEPADRSRAIASLITPAMVHGGLLGGRAPVDLSEADQSQTGKGYRNKVTAAIYGQAVRAVTQRKGGVGGLEESLDSVLIQGANFPCIDNARGRIDSPAIESLLTEDSYEARIPFSPAVEIDPRRIVLMMTSNQAELTPDLANRSSCVRILKQETGYQYAKYAEGDILDHIRANQPRFLGAVFSVIREWHRQGKQRTSEARHDFRAWAQTLDWIVQNIFGAAPLIDGHAETKTRMTNPTLSWLRDVAIAVREDSSFNQFLRTHQILNIIANSQSVEVPSLSDDDDLEDDKTRNKILRSLGRKIGRCFQSDKVTIDSYQIERTETTDDAGRSRKQYLFKTAESMPQNDEKTASEPDSPNRNGNPLIAPEQNPALNLQSPEVPESKPNSIF